MTDINDRSLLAEARKAADSYLLHKVVDDGMPTDVSQRLATTGFTAATRILSAMRRDGVGEDVITDRFQWQRDAARAAGDEQRIIAAEYTLAVWGGMRRDLAAYLHSTG